MFNISIFIFDIYNFMIFLFILHRNLITLSPMKIYPLAVEGDYIFY